LISAVYQMALVRVHGQGKRSCAVRWEVLIRQPDEGTGLFGGNRREMIILKWTLKKWDMTVCTGLTAVVTNVLGMFDLADGFSTLLPARRWLFIGWYGITSQKTRMLVPEPRLCSQNRRKIEAHWALCVGTETVGVQPGRLW